MNGNITRNQPDVKSEERIYFINSQENVIKDTQTILSLHI